MKRFSHTTEKPKKNILTGIVAFLVVFCAFFSGISTVSSQTSENQTRTLEQAISRSIAHCYATEGHYPETFSYIQEHYGITYDDEKYFIDYQVLGKNIFPDVTIIEK